LAVLFVIFGLYAQTHAGRHKPVWEGEGFGPPDWFMPYFLPSLIVYSVLGLIVWGCLLVLGLRLDRFVPAIFIWCLALVFNCGATLYWIFLTIHFLDPQYGNPGWFWIWMCPLMVTGPMACFTAVRVSAKLRRTKVLI
jgi:hypothetical protein